MGVRPRVTLSVRVCGACGGSQPTRSGNRSALRAEDMMAPLATACARPRTSHNGRLGAAAARRPLSARTPDAMCTRPAGWLFFRVSAGDKNGITTACMLCGGAGTLPVVARSS